MTEREEKLKERIAELEEFRRLALQLCSDLNQAHDLIVKLQNPDIDPSL